MTMERTDTRQEIFPERKGLLFVITEPVKKMKSKNDKLYYVFKLQTAFDGRTRKFTHNSMVWMSKDLLRALQYKEVDKGIFEWDREKAAGAQFIADVVHEPDFNDKSQDRAVLKNFRSIGPVPLQNELDAADEIPATPSSDDIPF